MTFQIDHKISGEHVGRTAIEASSSLHALCLYIEDNVEPETLTPFVGVYFDGVWRFRNKDHVLSAEPIMREAKAA